MGNMVPNLIMSIWSPGVKAVNIPNFVMFYSPHPNHVPAKLFVLQFLPTNHSFGGP